MLNNGHILTASEMRQAEQDVIEAGTSVEELMQRAGEGAAHIIWRVSADMPTLVICGPGNNGGDGYVIAQWLLEKGIDIAVAQVSEPKTDAARNAASHYKGEVIPIADASKRAQVVDCVFGTGLTRAVDAPLHDDMQRLISGARRRIAIDLPSGVETDNGQLLNEIAPFDLTISLGAYKPSHFLLPARDSMGSLAGVEIGISVESNLQILAKPRLKPPQATDHKYTRGLVAVIGGQMPGAAQLAALAAQRSGAGYVKLFAQDSTPSPCPGIVKTSYGEAGELRDMLSDPRISAVIVGPGLGRGKYARQILEIAVQTNWPILLDADALMVIGGEYCDLIAEREAPTVATPHGGEFQAMGADGGRDKIELTRSLAKQSQSVILHKGHDSVISGPDGVSFIADRSSNWLSIAGTGDVLSGIIGGRLAVSGDAIAAAREGQWLHMRAAQLAGPAFTPEQLIDHVPSALQECL